MMRYIAVFLSVASLCAISVLLLTGESRARGLEGIDLTGVWSFELGGDEPLSCSAEIEQTPSREPFDIVMECPGFGASFSSSGRVDAETNVFQVWVQFNPPTPPGLHIQLDGRAADDGESIAGEWSDVSGKTERRPFTATRTGDIVSPLPTLPTPVDLTGTWHIDLTGDTFDFNCDAVLQQKGPVLDGAASCSVFGWMDIAVQRFDATTGALTMDAYGWSANFVNLEGMAPDSDSIVGTWLAIGGYSGEFTAERAPVELHDFTGDWDALLVDSGERCAISFVQDILLLDASVDCGALGAGEFAGSIDPIEGSFGVEGLLGDLEMSISGRSDVDGDSIVGQLSQGFSQSWKLVAAPAGRMEHGVLAVDCNPEREGLWNECFGEVDEEYKIVIELLLPPAELPARVEFALEYANDLAAYHPAADPRDEATDRCTDIVRTVSDGRATFSCLVSAGVQSGPLLTLTASCLRDVRVAPWVSFLHLRPVAGLPEPALADGAFLPCDAPRPRRYIGDANCDGELTSIDAALVLQLEADLIDELPCRTIVDITQDGNVDSRDAALILQWVAGLLAPPP